MPEEAVLADYCRELTTWGYPFTKGEVWGMAESLYALPLGKNWVDKFLVRN